MAAYNFHRKIFEEPDNSTDFCQFDCDPVKNPTGVCLPICSLKCPTNCNTTVTSPPQLPPLPTGGGGGYILTPPPQHHHSSLSLPLKISIVILVLTFSFFLLYTLYKFYTVWYRSWRRRPATPAPQNQETHDEFLDHDVLDHPIWYIRTIGLQPSLISAITVIKYSKTDGLIDGTDCSVCLSDFQEDETLRLLPKCNHAFHISCIDTWLRSHTNCPLCRAGIVKNTTNSADSVNSGQIEDTQIAISITDETDGDHRQMEDEDDNQNSDLTIGVVGGSGIRRSVSLNDYEACRIRSDIRNNNYYSDRHDVQIESVDGNLGLDLVKIVPTPNNIEELSTS